MPLGKKRLRVAFGLAAARGKVHRYTWIRLGIALLATMAVGALPGLDLLRFDFWGGDHHVLGESVDLQTAAKAFAFPFLGINVGIILTSRFLGRWLCGFVCPIGHLARIGEWIHWRRRKDESSLHHRARQGLVLAGNALMAWITLIFWVDPHVFVDGSTFAKSLSLGMFLGLTLGFQVIVLGLGLRFCRDLCPSGIYFSLLGPKTSTGVEFAHPEMCTECKACESVCPMELEPRLMETTPERDGFGLYPTGLSSHAQCIRCGDCIAACEGTTDGFDGGTPLRMGWLPAEGQRGEERGIEIGSGLPKKEREHADTA